MIEYATLKVLWWGVLALLATGLTVLDGFDMGVAILLPFLGKTDDERRVIMNSVGPTWEANLVWLVTLGGATFAAWPLVYATAFSGFYPLFMLVLFSLFFRPLGLDYHSKLEHPRWRRAWDGAIFTAGIIPTLVFGVIFGNLLQGVPIEFDQDMIMTYSGSFFSFWNPFALLASIVGIAMLVMHGSAYLQLRVDGDIQSRARGVLPVAALAVILSFAGAGYWVSTGMDGFRIVSMPPVGTAFLPTAKSVVVARGAWLDNFHAHAWMWGAPALTFLGAIGAVLMSRLGRNILCFLCTTITVVGVVLTPAFAMFPFIIPSSIDGRSSLTMWDAVSSHGTLNLMFWLVGFLFPAVLAYTAWVYRVTRGKVSLALIRESPHAYY